MVSISELAHIEDKHRDPLKMFKEWKDEMDSNTTSYKWLKDVFCLATASEDGSVTNRNVVLKELDDGFIFVTDKRGRKVKDMEKNPQVAATFLWNYFKGDVAVIRQVRVEGTAHIVNEEKCQQYYDQELAFGKIRTHLCQQGAEIKWEELKQRHDDLLRKYEKGELDLLKPDHYIAFKIRPHRVEFYYTFNDCIADRVEFTKAESTWDYVHLAA